MYSCNLLFAYDLYSTPPRVIFSFSSTPEMISGEIALPFERELAITAREK